MGFLHNINVFIFLTGKALPINEARVSRVSPFVLKMLLRNCTRLSLLKEIKVQRRGRTLIYPGTNWCRMGDQTNSYYHLGSRHGVDSCCRDHDRCKISIPAFGRKYNINNFTPITWSHCECDRKFKRCLQTQSRHGYTSASIISTIYFNVLLMQCIEVKRTEVCARRGVFSCTLYTYQNRWVASYA